MCRAQLGTGEAPAQGESCCGAGSAHPALLISPRPRVSCPLSGTHHPPIPHLSCRLCVGRCPPFCSPAGPPTLQYQVLPLPLGIAARRDVVHLTPATSLRHRPIFRLLEQDPDSPFALRSEQGQGIISTLRPLREPGTHRLKVQALLPDGQRAPSIFLLLISVSPYPY